MCMSDLFRHKYDRNNNELCILQHPLLLIPKVTIFDVEGRVAVHMAEICLGGFTLETLL